MGYEATSDANGAVSLSAVREALEAAALNGKRFPSLQMLNEAKPLVNYNVKVTNTGKMDADDVVLGFLVPPGAGQNGVPLQTLFGFERIHVKAGETVSVDIYPSLLDFTHTMLDGTKSVVEGE